MGAFAKGVMDIKFMTVVSVVSLSEAATLRYNGGGNWENVSNNDTGWGENPNNPPVANGSLPGAGDTARINFAGNTVIVDSEVPTTERVQIGVDESGELLIEDGGVLTTTNDVLAGNNNMAATGTLTVNSGGEVSVGRILWAAHNDSTGLINIREGGVVNVASHLWWGVSGSAEITISGTLNQTGGILGLGTLNAVDPAGGRATVNVNDGGLLALNNIHASGTSIQPDSVLNINGTGQVTLPGDLYRKSRTISRVMSSWSAASWSMEPEERSWNESESIGTGKRSREQKRGGTDGGIALEKFEGRDEAWAR